MKVFHVAAVVVAVGFLATTPAFAQTTPDSAKPNMQSTQKQHTAGEGSSDGGFYSSKGVQKQPAQSFSHPDGVRGAKPVASYVS